MSITSFVQSTRDYIRQLVTLPSNVAACLDRLNALESAAAPTPEFPPAGVGATAVPAEVYAGYSTDDLRIFDLFGHANPKPSPGFVTDFIGTKTRTTSLWNEVRFLDGQVMGRPVPYDLFEAIEWVGLLKAVKSATRSFTMMELGAGWGPWLAAAAVACRLRKITDLHLTGVEADPGRFDLMRQHFLDNGLNPDAHELFCAAVGPEAGRARWPKISDPPNAGGGRPVRQEASALNSDDDAYMPLAEEQYVDVDIMALGALLQRRPIWDLVHIDIQGWESELVAKCIAPINERVKWLIIGTHSRAIDGALIETLFNAGWLLENEKPTRFIFDPNKKSLAAMAETDGAQVWRNPRLAKTP